jgi:hypothetical protein
VGRFGPPRVKRRRTCSASAVPSRRAVVYFTIWSYCWRIRSQLIVLVDSTGARCGQLSSSPAAGRYSRAEPMFFSLGISLKSSMWAKAKPTMDAPCVSVYCRSTSMSVQCRSTPSIIDATSEAERGDRARN